MSSSFYSIVPSPFPSPPAGAQSSPVSRLSTRPITWLRALSLLRQTPTPSGHGDKTLMRGSEDRLATDSTDRFPVAYKDWRSIRLVTSVLITSFSPSGVGFVGVGRDAILFPQGVRAEVVYSYKIIRPAYHSIK